tara:strand:- start:27889 stop:29106 length:1218 start_codon:yes stop_codon:yes gene_type:complete
VIISDLKVFDVLAVIFIGLSLALFFLVDDSQINTIPTYFLALLALAAPSLTSKDYKLQNTLGFKLAICFIAFSVISIVWSSFEDNRKIISILGAASTLLGFIFAGSHLLSKPGVGYGIGFIHFYLLLLVVAILPPVSDFVFREDILWHWVRLEGNGRLRLASVAAMCAGLGFVYALVLSISSKQALTTCGYLALSIFLFLALVFTKSRGSLLAVTLCVILITYFLSPMKIRVWLSALLLLGVGLFLVMVHQLYPELWESFLRKGLGLRNFVWRDAVSQWLSGNLVFGAGILSPFYSEAEYERVPGIMDLMVFQHPHSIFLAALVNTGLVGCTLLVAMIAAPLIPLVDIRNRNRLERCGFFGLVYAGFCLSFDGGSLITKVNELWIVFWCPFLIACFCCPSSGDRN